jgi:hypothetical protein
VLRFILVLHPPMLRPSSGGTLLAKTGMKRVEGLAMLTGSCGFIRSRRFRPISN